VLRFEVTPETLALWCEAMDQLRRSSNYALDDDSALLLMARHVLGGPHDEGRASYQIALCLCPECGNGQQQAGGELLPIGAEVIAMAHCDGQHLGLLRPANEAYPQTQTRAIGKALRPRRDARCDFGIIGAASSRDYGGGVNPLRAHALASTFVALRGLGFREGEIRRAQAEVLRRNASEDANIERLLRATLAKLTSSRGTSG
jgi:hypothetical protein